MARLRPDCCDPDEGAETLEQHAITRGAFRMFVADSRDTHVGVNRRAQRPETKEEAFTRRWALLPEANRQRYRRLLSEGMAGYREAGGSV